ncbi:MAG: hypothetical protein ABDH21_04960, partial [bacterium]
MNNENTINDDFRSFVRNFHSINGMNKSNTSKRMSFNEKISILVPSCDSYSDLWPIFFELFWRFWPDCPLNVYLISNEKAFSDHRIRNIRVGEDKGWSSNILMALSRIPEEYIFIFLEDLFICSMVDQGTMNKIFDWILLNSPEYIKLSPYPKSIDKIFSRDFISKIDQEDIYRTSVVLSVFRKDVLRDLLREGESAWDFEIYGTLRSKKYSNFYTVNKEIIKVVNGVIKGKWSYHSLNILKSLGITIQSNSRP